MITRVEEVSQIGWGGCGLGVVNSYIKAILHSLAHIKRSIIQQYDGPPCKVDAGGNPATKWYFTMLPHVMLSRLFHFSPLNCFVPQTLSDKPHTELC